MIQLPDVLRSERLTLRRPRAEDAGWIAVEIARPEVQRMLTSPPHPYEHDHAVEWLKSTAALPGYYVIEADMPVGVVTLRLHLETGELGYWLARDHWGLGYMTEAASMVLTAYFDRAGDPVPAGYIIDNPASANVLAKLGFVNTHQERDASAFRQGQVTVQKMQLTSENWAKRTARLSAPGT